MIAILGALTIITNIHPKLQGHEHRPMRTSAFVATAFTYTLVAKIGCPLPGTVLYTMRFPESRWPGRFDMCSSHSIMHILVVCAAVIQMLGYLEAFDYA
ncbi:hypothetical protein WHR41_09583, partial [Cladosporium halotolerans]